MIVGGIDPGIAGAIAVISELGDCETSHMPVMGAKGKKVVDGGAVVRFFRDRDVEFMVIEDVHSMPKQGVRSSFNFGKAFGQVVGITQGMILPHAFVPPQVWKKAMKLSADKELSRRRAIEMFPHAGEQFALVKDEARAEAALIAAYHLGMHLTRLRGVS